MITNISLASDALYENQPAGAAAGKLSATTQDAGAIFTYSLASGTGATDNSLFNIAGDMLKTAAPLNYEQKSTYHILVRAADQYGFAREQGITLSINNVNEVPTLDVVADQTICYSGEQQSVHLSGISAGEDKGQTTSLTVSADDATLFKSLTASGNKVQYTLQEGAAGKALVTVTLKDNGGTAHGGVDQLSRSFALTINPLPVMTITADNANPVSKGILTRLTASGAASYQWSNGPGIQSGWNQAILVIRPEQDATYTVTGNSAEGCTAQQHYALQTVADYKLICNNLISPNGDGKNDTWIIQNIESYPHNEVKIFDRSGRMIYHKKTYDNQWNGTLNGGRLHPGTYYYVFIVDGGKKIFKGFIELL
jgi:gliding motility-associated-like protein